MPRRIGRAFLRQQGALLTELSLLLAGKWGVGREVYTRLDFLKRK